ncbi:MAG: cellobiose phosphorylase [Chloroflexota bacterium]
MKSFPFDASGRYIIEDYAGQRPFSSFLPGVAGPMGIPMWVFYVNRGQGISSFGIESKDSPILEFQPANKAYRLAATTGFRTFLKIQPGERTLFYEPFAPWSAVSSQRDMHIGLNELTLVERNPELGLTTSVLYFTLVNEPLAGLVRKLTLHNTGEGPVDLEILDGLPRLIPYGTDNGALKHISRTIEAWMKVENEQQGIPFYRLKASAADHAQVSPVTPGHFALGWRQQEGGVDRLPVVVDPEVVFLQETSLHEPLGFLETMLDELLARPQGKSGKTPCAFWGMKDTLDQGESITLYSLYGHIHSPDDLPSQTKYLIQPGYMDQKLKEAREIVEGIVQTVQTKTSSPHFDAYVRQTYLDNVLRGGWPVYWDAEPRPHVFHIYSRKHGDLERDYNDFHLAPEYYSFGEGNYRDVNQNRRSDVLLDPRVGAKNVRDFLSLIQLDGYNPLVVKGTVFKIKPGLLSELMQGVKEPDQLSPFLEKGFTPGGLLKYVEDHQIALDLPPQEFLSRVMEHADAQPRAVFGDGYWVDHWTYLLDQIESYLAVFPERKRELLFESREIPYFQSPVKVRPRRERYVLTEVGPRQYHFLTESGTSGWVLTTNGEIYKSSIFEKLILLAGVKFGTLDPGGMGLEMEAGKPGWYDALNGLPGLFGSSLPESYELFRLSVFLRESLAETDRDLAFKFPVEFGHYLQALADLTEKEMDPFQRWDHANDLRETYREKVYQGISGKEISLSGKELYSILQIFEDRLQKGFLRAEDWAKNGLAPTYFRYRMTDYEIQKGAGGKNKLDPQGRPFLRAKGFQPQPLPLFLEGAVRSIKVAGGVKEVKAIHKAVKSSPLYDRKLNMYKVNASLEGQPHEIGRARAFTPGWLENESIWLHMEYKYVLELLKAGLYQEFFTHFKEILIPFQDLDRYGRSPLENSSFLVSSAHPQPALHGAGFVARLTGATAEFLQMWLLMMAGKEPFRYQNGDLELRFRPALPAWLFDEDDRLGFQFLGGVPVTYHNPRRIDTWDHSPVSVQLTFPDGSQKDFDNPVVPAPFARMVRERKVGAVDVFF